MCYEDKPEGVSADSKPVCQFAFLSKQMLLALDKRRRV
jgi:hypothetical protein